MLLFIIASLFFFIATLGFIIFCILTAGIYFFGAPFVVSSNERIRFILKLLKPQKGEKIVDLGSGDGTLLFEIAKSGAIAYGYEINPILVRRTKRKIKKLGLEGKVFVERANFLKKDLSDFDAIVVYGITYLMPRLEKKLQRELKPGTRVVSNYFKFPNWKPEKKEGDVLIYKR